MDAFEKNKIREFGNPSGYYDNKLYKLFSEKNLNDIFYRIVFYGQKVEIPAEITLKKKVDRLLRRKIDHQQNRVRLISKVIGEYETSSIWLDLGCGIGQFIEKISKIKGNFVVGSDTSISSLKEADYLLKKYSSAKNYRLVNQDKSELPFKNNSFDYILSADVLEHVGYENHEKFLYEIYRVLKNNGKAVIHTPNLNRAIITTIIKKIFYIFKGFNPKYITYSFPKDHISMTSAKKIRKLSRFIGFRSKILYNFRQSYSNLRILQFFKLEFIFPRSFIIVLSKK